MNLVPVFSGRKFNLDIKSTVFKEPFEQIGFKKLNEKINEKYENRKIVPTKQVRGSEEWISPLRKAKNIDYDTYERVADFKRLLSCGYNENSYDFNTFEGNDDDGAILDYDSEVALLYTYRVGRTYDDPRGTATYTITSYSDDKVWYIRNKYLHKYKYQTDSMTRTQFLEMMKFQSGELTESMMSMD